MRRGAVATAAAFAVALALLVVVHHDDGGSNRLSGEEAVAAALRDPAVRWALARSDYTRSRTTPIDDRLVRVSFFDGPRIVLDAAVDKNGKVHATNRFGDRYVRAGSDIGQDPMILLILSMVFAIAAARAPLESKRNRDVTALIAFAAPVLLMNARLLEWSVYAAVPPLVYLGVRCVRVAFTKASAAQPSTSLLDDITAGLTPRARRRMLVLAVGAAALALALLSIPGGLVGDVAFASMAGATGLLHGALPYGHLPQTELIHGDTYPLLAYALYIPAALVSPVDDAFDSIDGALFVATGFALAGALAMYLVGRRLSAGDSRSAGLRMALAWLSFPPVMIATSSGSNDVLAGACVAWALASIAYAGRSALAVAVAGTVKLVPFLLLPAWVLCNRSAGALRAAGGAAVAVFGVAAWIFAVGGASGFGDMLNALSFQAERGSLLSVWTLTGTQPLQLVFQAAVITFVLASAVRVWRDRELAADPGRIAALGAAILIGVQLAANYWTYVYLPWLFPLVAVALLCERPAQQSAPEPAADAPPLETPAAPPAQLARV